MDGYHPLMTATGLKRATFRAIPALLTTFTTPLTSLSACGASSAKPDIEPARILIPYFSSSTSKRSPLSSRFALARLMIRPTP
nr:hypothetical protein [Tolypothrix sp. FACHB-123]